MQPIWFWHCNVLARFSRRFQELLCPHMRMHLGRWQTFWARRCLRHVRVDRWIVTVEIEIAQLLELTWSLKLFCDQWDEFSTMVDRRCIFLQPESWSHKIGIVTVNCELSRNCRYLFLQPESWRIHHSSKKVWNMWMCIMNANCCNKNELITPHSLSFPAWSAQHVL